MFPSKSMVDYMTEINRLFPQNDDAPSYAFNSFLSPFQPSKANRSSSSTDSTSPESHPESSCSADFFQHDQNHRISNNNPLINQQHRPIIGRKILGAQQTQKVVPSPVEKMNFDLSFWHHEEPLSVSPLENTTQCKRFLYERFSPDTKAHEFQTPVKSVSSNQLSNFSPIWSNNSPKLSKRSQIETKMTNLSPSLNYQSGVSNPTLATTHLSPPWSNSFQSSTSSAYMPKSFTNTFSSTHFATNDSNFGPRSSSDEIQPTKMCTFCRKNGETPVVYMTHCVKEKIGSKNIVTCPILRSHVCSTCGASGDNAHTITYCPVLRSTNNGKPLQSTTITLKNTRIKSNGKRRY